MEKDAWEDPLATKALVVLRGGLNFFRVPPRPSPGRFFSGRLSMLPWFDGAARRVEGGALPAATSRHFLAFFRIGRCGSASQRVT